MTVRDILLNRIQYLQRNSGLKANTKKSLTDIALLNLLNELEIYNGNSEKIEDFISTLEMELGYISETKLLLIERNEINKKKLELY